MKWYKADSEGTRNHVPVRRRCGVTATMRRKLLLRGCGAPEKRTMQSVVPSKPCSHSNRRETEGKQAIAKL
jgi:hypothetical protein